MLKYMKNNPVRAIKVAAIAIAMLPVLNSIAQADQVFTSRSAFEAALGSFSVDGQENNSVYFQTQQIRPDYLYTGSNFGSINHSGTADNSSRGMDAGGYIWTYAPGPHTFAFNAQINAFGFDYAQYIGYNTPLSFDIDGYVNPSPGVAGFFGVIYDNPTSTITLHTYTDYLLYDNVTYGTSGSSSVPDGGATALMLSFGILVMGVIRRTRS